MVRCDKKFQVKIYVEPQNKLLFKRRCIKHHLSMMFVSSNFIAYVLKNKSDEQVKEMIESNLSSFYKVGNKFDTISARLTDEYWQQLGAYSIDYQDSISKIASCIFTSGLSTIEMTKVFEDNGLIFKYMDRGGFR